MPFLFNNLEVFSALLALLCVWLAAINHIWNWPVAMVSSIGYIVVFYQSQLYSDAFLNIVFLLFQSYGWISWKQQGILSPQPMKKKSVARLLLVMVLLYPFWVNFITYHLPQLPVWVFGNSKAVLPPPKFPWIDAALMLCSLLALIMQSKRWIEHWYLWVAVDIVYVPMYYLSGNTITAILYFIYIGLAVYGYGEWKRISSPPRLADT